ALPWAARPPVRPIPKPILIGSAASTGPGPWTRRSAKRITVIAAPLRIVLCVIACPPVSSERFRGVSGEDSVSHIFRDAKKHAGAGARAAGRRQRPALMMDEASLGPDGPDAGAAGGTYRPEVAAGPVAPGPRFERARMPAAGLGFRGIGRCVGG